MSAGASTAFVGFTDYQGASILYAVAMPNSGDDVANMWDLLSRELAKIRDEGVTDGELARVKQQVRVETLTFYRESVLITAEWLQDATSIFGDPASIADELAMYEAVSIDDILRVAQTYLCDQPMHLQLVVPDGEEKLPRTSCI